MPGYVNSDLVHPAAGVDCLASATTAVTKNFAISESDSKNILVRVDFSLIEETTGMAVVLQDSYDNGTTWATVQTTNVATTAGVQTLTFAAKAATGDGNYVVVEDRAGTKWAIAADLTGTSPEPTGAIWTAIPAANKAQSDISATTDAASVAAAFELAFDGLTGFTALIVTSDVAANGTMTFTQVKGGTIDDVVSNLEDDSGAGSVTAANTTPGAATLTYELENNIYNTTDTAIWPIARVVVTTGTGDTGTVSAVRVSRRL